MDSWFFIVYQLMLFPVYIFKTGIFLLIHLFYLKSINNCATYFTLIKIKIRELNACIDTLKESEIQIKLKHIIDCHVQASK